MQDSKQPEKEHLPAFKTLEECRAYCELKGDSFYIDAFMLEAWIGMIVTKTVEQYAEKKSGKRRLQSGAGWEAWQYTFGHAKPDEWSFILQSLARFGGCDTPEAEMAGEMFALIALEEKHAEPVSLSAFFAQAAGGKLTAPLREDPASARRLKLLPDFHHMAGALRMRGCWNRG